MRATDFELRIPELSIACRRWGTADGDPVLALHGWLDNAASFDRLAPLLPGLDLVVPDLPGHGHSDHRPKGMPYHFVDGVADVITMADELGWERFAVIGHSMGAGIASMIPAAIPGRISHLVVMDGLGPLSGEASEAASNLARSLARARHPRPVRLVPDTETAIEARRAGSDLDADTARLLVERSLEPAPGGYRFRHDQRLQQPSRLRFTEEQVLSFLSGIDCPTLAVRASAGLPMMTELISSRLEAVPNLTEVEVQGGHHIHLDNPEAVAGHIVEFLG